MAKQASNQFSSIFWVVVVALFIATAYFMGAMKTPGKLHRLVTGQPTESKMVETQPAALPTNSPRHPVNAVTAKCTDNGGTVSNVKRGRWGEYQVCNFEDDQSCELLALYRGDCPVGGVNTIGFDTKEQIYCAQLGGQTTTVAGASCTLPDGTSCTLAQVYQDTCPSD